MNKLEILGSTLAVMMFLSACASTADTNKNQPTEAAPVPGNTASAETSYVKYTPSPEATESPIPATSTPEATATMGELENIDSLFKESGTVKSEHMSMRVSQKSLEVMGIPNGFSVDPAKLEDAYKLLLSRWAWALAKGSDDPKLALFKDVNQKDAKAMLKAYNDNAALGKNGFDYYFDFGLPYGSGVNNIEGKVDKIDISVTSDQQEWDAIIQNLEKNGISFNVNYPSGGNRMAIFYFDKDGSLKIIYNGINDYTNNSDLISGYLISTFALPMCLGEYVIERALNVPESLTDPQSLWWLFDCGGPDFCLTPGSTSDFKY